MSTEDGFDYQAWAWKILDSKWAKPRDIAQAWVIAQTGATDAGDHWRFVAIARAHDWIKGLGLQTGDSNGMPARLRKAGPISPNDQGQPDIEAHAMVRVAEVKARAETEERPWPKRGASGWQEWTATEKRDNAPKMVKTYGTQKAAAAAAGVKPQTFAQYLPGGRMTKTDESSESVVVSNWPPVPAKPHKR